MGEEVKISNILGESNDVASRWNIITNLPYQGAEAGVPSELVSHMEGFLNGLNTTCNSMALENGREVYTLDKRLEKVSRVDWQKLRTFYFNQCGNTGIHFLKYCLAVGSKDGSPTTFNMSSMWWGIRIVGMHSLIPEQNFWGLVRDIAVRGG